MARDVPGSLLSMLHVLIHWILIITLWDRFQYQFTDEIIAGGLEAVMIPRLLLRKLKLKEAGRLTNAMELLTVKPVTSAPWLFWIPARFWSQAIWPQSPYVQCTGDKRPFLRARRPDFESDIYSFPAVPPWINYLTALCRNFLIWTMGRIMELIIIWWFSL